MTSERCSHTTYDIDGERCFCPECGRNYDYTDAEKADFERRVFDHVKRELASWSAHFDVKTVRLLYKYAMKYKRIVEEAAHGKAD